MRRGVHRALVAILLVVTAAPMLAQEVRRLPGRPTGITDLQGAHRQVEQLDARMRSVEVRLGLAKPQVVTPPQPVPQSPDEMTARLAVLERRVLRAEADVQTKAGAPQCVVDGGEQFRDGRGVTWNCSPYRCVSGPPPHCPDSCKSASNCLLGFGCDQGACKKRN